MPPLSRIADQANQTGNDREEGYAIITWNPHYRYCGNAFADRRRRVGLRRRDGPGAAGRRAPITRRRAGLGPGGCGRRDTAPRGHRRPGPTAVAGGPPDHRNGNAVGTGGSAVAGGTPNHRRRNAVGTGGFPVRARSNYDADGNVRPGPARRPGRPPGIRRRSQPQRRRLPADLLPALWRQPFYRRRRRPPVHFRPGRGHRIL